MVTLHLDEARLFRLLSNFFGDDHVVPNMRVIAVCGGSLPAELELVDDDLTAWARENRCLFTIVDQEDTPKLVIEFFSGFSSYVDPTEADHQRYLRPILAAARIPYVTISEAEFQEIIDPGSGLDLVSLLREKVEPPLTGEIE